MAISIGLRSQPSKMGIPAPFNPMTMPILAEQLTEEIQAVSENQDTSKKRGKSEIDGCTSQFSDKLVGHSPRFSDPLRFPELLDWVSWPKLIVTSHVAKPIVYQSQIVP